VVRADIPFEEERVELVGMRRTCGVRKAKTQTAASMFVPNKSCELNAGEIGQNRCLVVRKRETKPTAGSTGSG